MTEQEEREIEKLNQGRLLRDAGQILLPILSQMKTAVLARIIQEHRDGCKDRLPSFAAELSVLEELTGRIIRNNKETAKREEKFNANAD